MAISKEPYPESTILSRCRAQRWMLTWQARDNPISGRTAWSCRQSRDNRSPNCCTSPSKIEIHWTAREIIHLFPSLESSRAAQIMIHISIKTSTRVSLLKASRSSAMIKFKMTPQRSLRIPCTRPLSFKEHLHTSGCRETLLDIFNRSWKAIKTLAPQTWWCSSTRVARRLRPSRRTNSTIQTTSVSFNNRRKWKYYKSAMDQPRLFREIKWPLQCLSSSPCSSGPQAKSPCPMGSVTSTRTWPSRLLESASARTMSKTCQCKAGVSVAASSRAEWAEVERRWRSWEVASVSGRWTCW